MKDKHERRLAILVHKNPDSDALASAVMVKAWYAEEHGYKPENIAISGNSDFAYLHKDALDGETLHNDLDDAWKGCDVCVVDTPTPRFLEKPQRAILKGAKKVIIYDHHLNSDEAFKSAAKEDVEVECHVNSSIDSCCEHIYRLMSQDMRRKLSRAQLEACLVGMYSDSNGFMYSPQETMDTAREIITLGARVKCITHCALRDLGTWGKFKYLAEVPKNIMWLKDSKIAIIKTSFTEHAKANKSIDKSPANNRTPLYILTTMYKERLKYSRTMHAYLLVYDREWENNAARYIIVLDLIKWSPERQLKLKEIGFPVFRERQCRYYMCVCHRKYFGICKDIDEALVATHSDDLIDLYELDTGDIKYEV